ncbi:class I SAM-dependent methyltransferase [Yoonia sp. 2307UL14-13]|uniref:class I SAM-dependent methyltransferase n=1 Tax=Yoonia sp. 2307UL14-13 TaxID=3126506 RepID=UPI0030A0AF94
MTDRPADNTDQAEFWGTTAGRKWVVNQTVMDKLMAPVLKLVLSQAALQPGEHILDIGCGAGTSTVQAAAQVGPRGNVTGVDISDTLLTHARHQFGEAPNMTWLKADAQTHAFAQHHYDALISRFGVMFFADSVVAFRNMGQALKPGSRMIFACWGPAPENPWFTIPAKVAADRLGKMSKTDRTLPGPFALEDQARVIDMLTRSRLHNIKAETHELHLTPTGGAQDAAKLCCEIGPAERALRHFDGNAADRAAIIEGITLAFAPYNMRIPANINLFRAETAG